MTGPISATTVRKLGFDFRRSFPLWTIAAPTHGHGGNLGLSSGVSLAVDGKPRGARVGTAAARAIGIGAAMAVAVAGCTSSTTRKPPVSEPRSCLGSPLGGRLAVMNARPQTADGMPELGQTTRARVEAVFRDRRTDILARCAHSTAVALTRWV